MKRKRKKSNESYSITFLGLLCCNLEQETAKTLQDAIELYMRRFGYNAIVLDGNEFIFTKVEKVCKPRL